MSVRLLSPGDAVDVPEVPLGLAAARTSSMVLSFSMDLSKMSNSCYYPPLNVNSKKKKLH